MAKLDNLRQMAAGAARHESGHYVIARALGFRVTELYINTDLLGVDVDGGSGMMPHWQLTSLDAVIDYLERRIQVLCAGVLAEFLSGETVDENAAMKSWKTGKGVNDWVKERECVHTNYGIKYPAIYEPTNALKPV